MFRFCLGYESLGFRVIGLGFKVKVLQSHAWSLSESGCPPNSFSF